MNHKINFEIFSAQVYQFGSLITAPLEIQHNSDRFYAKNIKTGENQSSYQNDYFSKARSRINIPRPSFSTNFRLRLAFSKAGFSSTAC